MTNTNIYSLGGTVQASKGTYISRQADEKLLELCKQAEFSYVLTSRQMGKSSLMINTASELKKADIKFVIIDLTKIGTQVTIEQWYLGLLVEIEEQLVLETNIVRWWQANDNLGVTQRLSKFFEHVLLEEVKTPIVIFIDEIDTTLSLDFTDDFFAAIRHFYVARAENYLFERISFVLIGVATPGDLIRDLRRTSYNIGRLVDLTNFTFEEAKPLAEGFGLPKEEAEKLLRYVLKWTSGQPFLTQKLCKLIAASADEIPRGNEEFWLENLVKKRIIENWKKQDEPQHLRTIRDRILKNERRAGKLLGIYQKILNAGEIEVDSSCEQIELRLSGLVVESQGKLRVYNRICKLVFDLNWVEKQLAKLRPYAQNFKSWVDSNCQEESYLLHGQALQDAKAWAVNKDLSDLDFKFLTACQELEKSQVQVQLEAQKQANKFLAQAEQDAKKQASKLLAKAELNAEKKANNLLAKAELDAEKRVAQAKRQVIAIGIRIVSTCLVLSLGVLVFSLKRADDFYQEAEKQQKKVDEEQKKVKIERGKAWYYEAEAAYYESDVLLLKGNFQRSLVKRVEAGKKIYKIENEIPKEFRELLPGIKKLKDKILAELQSKRIDSLENQYTDWDVIFSPEVQLFASASRNRISLRKLDGKNYTPPDNPTHKSKIISLSFSPDGKLLASASNDNFIKLWKLGDSDWKWLKDIELSKNNINRVISVSFSSDTKTLICVYQNKKIQPCKSLPEVDTISENNSNRQDLKLEGLLNNACNRISDYLKDSPNLVREEEKKLCDDI